jgi:hypothetical protein
MRFFINLIVEAFGQGKIEPWMTPQLLTQTGLLAGSRVRWALTA